MIIFKFFRVFTNKYKRHFHLLYFLHEIYCDFNLYFLHEISILIIQFLNKMLNKKIEREYGIWYLEIMNEHRYL